MIIAPGCLCGFRCVARYIRVDVSVVFFFAHPLGCVVVCDCMWSSLRRLSLPPPGCDSSSIWVRRAGWAAVLLVIASEMNYLASETEGGEEIVIELPPPSRPLPYASSYYICSTESHFLSAHRHKHMHTLLQNNFLPSPMQWTQQRTILMQGDFIDWLFTGTCTLGHTSLLHSY